MEKVPEKVLIDQTVKKEPNIVRWIYRTGFFPCQMTGAYWTTKSWWQDRERTWTTEWRVWETLYDCVFAPLLRGFSRVAL